MGREHLRGLPSVDELLRDERIAQACKEHSPGLVASAARAALDRIRLAMLSGARGEAARQEIAGAVLAELARALEPSVRKVVNASGTILHTNIGRAVLAEEAAGAAAMAARSNINLEMELPAGERGDRDSLVEGLLKRLSSAEAASVVNNNAAAVLLSLNTLAEGSEVVISRGELIEIGGSFRLPDIIRKSGCVLKEVGTTNRTHPSDYESAITGRTALIVKAHTSNYRVVGFAASVPLAELVAIGGRHGVPVMEDLGSGSLVDLSAYGLPREPVVSDSVRAGAAIVTFSGDKLLGGPQSGIIAGSRELVEKVRKNPLKRALRADKLTLSALEATLRLYLNPVRLCQSLPTLRYMARPMEEIESVASEARSLLESALGSGFSITVEQGESVVGGGSLPGHTLPTWVVAIASDRMGPDAVFRLFLSGRPPVLGRIHKDRFLLDARTVDSAADLAPALDI